MDRQQPSVIAVRQAAEHNLKGIDVDIPRGALIVVTGVSGSGKSSLAFDTVGTEGRRRYLQTFSSHARQFLGRLSRPAVGRLDGLSPAVILDQSAVIRTPRSTVGTLTELFDLLRLLWARAGTLPEGSEVPLERRLFSFNSPYGACPACRGLGVEDRLDPDLLVAKPERTVREGALRITTPNGYLMYSQVTLDVLDQVCRAHGFTIDVRWRDLTPEQRDVILNGSDRLRVPYGKHPLASRLEWTGITAKPREEGTYKGILPVMAEILRHKRNKSILRFVRSLPCRECGGSRLRQEARDVRYRGLGIADAAARPIDDLQEFFGAPGGLANRASRAATARAEAEIVSQFVARASTLQRLGLGYLALDRDATTLSGGEARRIRLARFAGIGLSGVLYVLDEPTLGLHHRETQEALAILEALRDEGNTVLVVEHDEQAIRRADWVVDVGPGAGDGGGEVLYAGPAAPFTDGSLRVARSRTQAFLAPPRGEREPPVRRPGAGLITVSGVTRHNLVEVTADFRARALNVIAGVSGAGKSTLLAELASRLRREAAGSGSTRVRGRADRVDRVVEVNQAPIGSTPRSNPATYTGLFDRVRERFASEPAAMAKGFGKARFSFNLPGGRCEACEGAGVLQVGMQFLGTVAVPCDTCGGRRFNRETLEVEFRGRAIDDVLAMSVDEAARFFSDDRATARPLEMLQVLGLGYLAIGHPATLLSGGEAQRVKLAAELARPARGHTVYLLDEPTTGLHPDDVAHLIDAVARLIARSGTVVAIEHDLQVIEAADWVVELGPGSGSRGGRIVAIGTPEQIARAHASPTGAALAMRWAGVGAERDGRPARARLARAPLAQAQAPIRLRNVTTHNLQHLDIEIAPGMFTVVTGVSGSGKSSLAFDTIFAEGRRRFSDTFSTYARRFLGQGEGAAFDEASGLTPPIAISQHAPSRNPRSTVATLTEIHHHYRLLFSRAGERCCPSCGDRLKEGNCLRCGYSGAPRLSAAMFSPNSQAGACPACDGLGVRLECDPSRLITDPGRPLASGAMAGTRAGRFYGDPDGRHMATLAAAARALGVDFSPPWASLDEAAKRLALHGAGDRVFDVEWAFVRGARRGVHRFAARWEGLSELVRAEYVRKHADRRGEALETLMRTVVCSACGGARLKPESRAVRFRGRAIHEMLSMSVDASLSLLEGGGDENDENDDNDDNDGSAAGAASRTLVPEVVRRLSRLQAAGLGYLPLDRPASTLSGGEAQRVRIASALDSGLTGVTYVLDEPTIGLHPGDTERLVALVRALTAAGNTVVAVEHDLDVIRAADCVIDLGPGAGRLGGRIVAQGPPSAIAADEDSTTGMFLREAPRMRGKERTLRPGLSLRGVTLHNLRGLDVDLPAGGLVVVTGVSGSGKSSLVLDALAPLARQWLESDRPAAGAGRESGRLLVHEPFADLRVLDDRALGLAPHSSPATVTGFFDAIKEAFARTPAARAERLGVTAFSLSAPGGRCEACEGTGEARVSMDFLPDVWVPCEECRGARYQPRALGCTIDGSSIADVLAMTGAEAAAFVERVRPADRRLSRAIAALADANLGYVPIGQPARTLSGGERLRLALARTLLAASPTTLYVFDEPTTGLHPLDVRHLLALFDRLVDAGHTIVAIEHELHVIAAADWVIDLGPEGGDRGGQVVATGHPLDVTARSATHTAVALRRFLGAAAPRLLAPGG